MDGWNTIVSFWGPAYFQVRTVSFRECTGTVVSPSLKPRKVDGNYWTHPCWATASEKTKSSGFQYMTESKFNLTLLNSNKTRFRSFCLLNQDFFGSRIGPPLSCSTRSGVCGPHQLPFLWTQTQKFLTTLFHICIGPLSTLKIWSKHLCCKDLQEGTLHLQPCSSGQLQDIACSCGRMSGRLRWVRKSRTCPCCLSSALILLNVGLSPNVRLPSISILSDHWSYRMLGKTCFCFWHFS